MKLHHVMPPMPRVIGRGTGRVCLNGAIMSLVLKDGMVVVIEADQTGQHFHQVGGASRDAVYLAA